MTWIAPLSAALRYPTPAKMKEQIMTLLDEWKEKQPPELAKAPKKMEKDK